MRYLVIAGLMTAGVAWIALEARSQDGYYGSQDVTRWEHASRAGSAPVVLGGVAVASVIALIFLLEGARRRRLGAPAVACAVTIYVLAWAAAWIGLVGGH